MMFFVTVLEVRFDYFFLNPLECIEAICLTSHCTIACLIYLGPFGQSLPGVQAHTSVPAGQYDCPPHLAMGGRLLCDFCLEIYIDAYPATSIRWADTEEWGDDDHFYKARAGMYLAESP